MPEPAPASGATPAGAVVLIAVAVLYFGRDIFIPLALAVLLAFVLTPLLLWLRHVGVPRIPSVVAAVLVAFAVLGGVAVVVGTQAVELAGNLPTYRRTIEEKLGAVRQNVAGGGTVERITGMLRDLRRVIAEPRPGPSERAGRERQPGAELARREPVPVVIESGPTQPLDLVQTILGPLVGPLGTAGLVIVFVVFILIEREDLRDRFIKLAGRGDLQRSTEAISDAAARVSRYLVAQLMVNASYGIPIGAGLWLIGVPNAALWGLLATVLRFIPYLGPWLAALFPIALAIAVDPGWWMLIWVIALFLVMELVSNNVVEPWAYGSSTGLSSFAVIIAAIFWTTLWGPAGLFLATPLTVCLVVIGRYVPGLEFLGVLLGNDPVLAPEERFYQRLLAGNVEEAIEMAEEAIAQSSPVAFLDTVALPALRLAENDRRRTPTTGFRRTVAEAMEAVLAEIVELDGDVGTQQKAKARKGGDSAAANARARAAVHARGRILCIGGRTELDEAAARLLAGRLGELGFDVEVLPPLSVGRAGIGQLALDGVAAVCLSYLDAAPQAYARFACRRIGRRGPGVARIVCLWNVADAGLADLAQGVGAEAVATGIAAAEERVLALSAAGDAKAIEAHTLSDRDRAMLRALRDAGLERGNGPAFRRLADEAATAFGSAIVLVTLAGDADPDTATVPAIAAEAATLPPQPREAPLCRTVIASGDPFVVEDVAKDERWAEDAVLLEKGIRFYAGAPIRAADGAILGALCLLDTVPRSFPAADRARLASLAEAVAGYASPEGLADVRPADGESRR